MKTVTTTTPYTIYWTYEQYPSPVSTIERWCWVENVVYRNGSGYKVYHR